MICNTAGESTISIEQINVSINAEPKVLILSELSPPDQAIYNEFAGQFMVNITTCIENYPDSVDGARFSDVVIDDNPTSFDYDTLVALDKAKVDNFMTLVNTI